jgi:hypothetical protein
MATTPIPKNVIYSTGISNGKTGITFKNGNFYLNVDNKIVWSTINTPRLNKTTPNAMLLTNNGYLLLVYSIANNIDATQLVFNPGSNTINGTPTVVGIIKSMSTSKPPYCLYLNATQLIVIGSDKIVNILSH